MCKDIKEQIADFISYYRQQSQLIENHCPHSIEGDLHKRILYLAVIDSLSKVIGSQKDNNRDRIIDFLDHFCNWPESTRISLPHLYQLVGNKKEPELAPIRNFALQRISSWIPGEIVFLARDPTLGEVEVLWPMTNGKPARIDGVSPSWIQHSNLFYTYRNSLIHEYRSPGHHAELLDSSEPYYATVIEYENDEASERVKSWQLQYTARFFGKLCSIGLSNLQDHLDRNNINPFELIDWNRYWIRELHQ
jgi:hypothetical protein